MTIRNTHLILISRRRNSGLGPRFAPAVERLFRFICLALLFFVVGAQSDARAQEYQVSIDFVTLIPRGELSQNIDNNGYGAGGQFLVRLKKSPFLVGGDIGFANYGTERRRESISETIPELEVEVSTTNNIFWTHAVLRAQPSSGKVRPYFDGLVGLKHFYTQTSINSDFSDETIAASTNKRDTAFSYGIGGGVQIHIADLSQSSQIVFDTKLRYLRGGEAEYLREGSIIRDGGNISFDLLRSRTDLLSFQIGVTFRF